MAGVVPGARVLDLCCGPGLLTRLIKSTVGAEGEVVADTTATLLDVLIFGVKLETLVSVLLLAMMQSDCILGLTCAIQTHPLA